MQPTRWIYVFAFVVFGAVCGSGVRADEGNLIVADKEIKLNVPVPLQLAVPLQLGSSFSAQFSQDTAGESPRVGEMVVSQGLRYPPLFGDLYSGNYLSENLLPSGKSGLVKADFNSTALTTWLNKQYASVNLSITHTHLIEKPGEQLTYGIYKTVSTLNNRLFLSAGQYLFNNLDSRYWYRTTDLSMDYAGKRWNLSLFVEQRSDSTILREQSVWASLKKSF